jgi:uncharacterized protein (TIGR03067 family)
LKKLEGTWIAVSWEWGGDLRADGAGLDLRYEIKGDEITSRGKGGGSFKMKITNFDPTAKPFPVMDLTRGDGPESQTISGIYKLEGDRLTICTARLPEGRPADFKTASGDRRLLRVFKREKVRP